MTSNTQTEQVTVTCPHCGATTIDSLENGAMGCSTCFKMWEPTQTGEDR